jgi:hypothetical protein
MPKPYYDIPYAGPAEMDVAPPPFTLEALFGEIGNKMEEKYPLPEPYRQWAGRPPMTDKDRMRMEETTREATRGAMGTFSGGGSGILKKMVEIKPSASKGALVHLPDLRKALNLPKEQFDKMIMDLAERDLIQLQSHDMPASLSKELREGYIQWPKEVEKARGRPGYWMAAGIREDALGELVK